MPRGSFSPPGTPNHIVALYRIVGLLDSNPGAGLLGVMCGGKAAVKGKYCSRFFWKFLLTPAILRNDCQKIIDPMISSIFSQLEFQAARNVLAGVAIFSLLPTHPSNAQESAVTDPVGVVTTTIPAGNGVSKSISMLSLPMINIAEDISGAATGTISAITSNSISDESANWINGELSNPENPKLLLITSGNAEGLILLLSTQVANTPTTVTIDPIDAAKVDLVSLGIQAGELGDTYKILDCDTLLSVFGTPESGGIVGADDFRNADHIAIFQDGLWSRYYYRNSSNSWVKNIRGFPSANNLRIKPDTGFTFYRIGTEPLNLYLFGSVPTTAHIRIVNNSGITPLGLNWPISQTISQIGLENLPDWQPSADGTNADLLTVFIGGLWKRYFWDGTSWRERRRGFPLAGDVIIDPGTSLLISRLPGESGTTLLVDETPY